MTVRKAEVLHTSINATPQRVYDFLSDLQNWSGWAPWIRSVRRTSGSDWTLETTDGPMRMRFVDANTLGILDHHVTLASGDLIYNPMRVVANGDGSELVFVLFQRDGMSDEQFRADRKAVEGDLARIRKAIEGGSRG